MRGSGSRKELEVKEGGKRLNFNPKALVRSACGLGAKGRASKKLGRSISYWETNNTSLLKSSFFQENQATTKKGNKKGKSEESLRCLVFYQTEIFP